MVGAVEHVGHVALVAGPHGGEVVGAAGLGQIPAVEGIAGTGGVGQRVVAVDVEGLLGREGGAAELRGAAVRVNDHGRAVREVRVLALAVVIVVVVDGVGVIVGIILRPLGGEGLRRRIVLPAGEAVAIVIVVVVIAAQRDISVNCDRRFLAEFNSRAAVLCVGHNAALRVDVDRRALVEGLDAVAVVVVVVADIVGRGLILKGRIEHSILCQMKCRPYCDTCRCILSAVFPAIKFFSCRNRPDCRIILNGIGSRSCRRIAKLASRVHIRQCEFGFRFFLSRFFPNRIQSDGRIFSCGCKAYLRTVCILNYTSARRAPTFERISIAYKSILGQIFATHNFNDDGSHRASTAVCIKSNRIGIGNPLCVCPAIYTISTWCRQGGKAVQVRILIICVPVVKSIAISSRYGGNNGTALLSFDSFNRVTAVNIKIHVILRGSRRFIRQRERYQADDHDQAQKQGQ